MGALRSPGIRTLVLVTLPMGFCFGAMEVTLPAFAEAHGHRPLAGVLVATWSFGSAIGGLAYGARSWRGAPGRRYARLAMLLPLGYLPLALAPTIPVMIPLAIARRLLHRADADRRQPDRRRGRAARAPRPRPTPGR